MKQRVRPFALVLLAVMTVMVLLLTPAMAAIKRTGAVGKDGVPPATGVRIGRSPITRQDWFHRFRHVSRIRTL